MFQRGFAFAAGQHACDLMHTIAATHLFDGGFDRPIFRFAFRDNILLVGPGCDLRQMGDDYDLRGLSEFRQSCAKFHRGFATDTRIDLIENERAVSRETV